MKRRKKKSKVERIASRLVLEEVYWVEWGTQEWQGYGILRLKKIEKITSHALTLMVDQRAVFVSEPGYCEKITRYPNLDDFYINSGTSVIRKMRSKEAAEKKLKLKWLLETIKKGQE